MLWNLIKYALTLFMMLLIPIYRHYYGITNFLWLCDIGLFLTLIGLWIHSPLLVSMAAVGAMGIELFWNLSFFSQLLFNKRITELSDYMFDRRYSLWLRAISLFHIFMPVLWLGYLYEFGYDARALFYFLPLFLINLIIVYCMAEIKKNINWVFFAHIYKLKGVSNRQWLIMLAIGLPAFVFVPTHFIFKYFFKAL